jgi:hypothetical protein
MTVKIILAATLLAGGAMAAGQDGAPAAAEAQPQAGQQPASPTATTGQANEAAQTGTVPTAQPAPAQSEAAAAQTPNAAPPAADPVILATPADVKPGAKVFDEKGEAVGTVESVTAQGAVVSTGKARVQIALGSFGKNKSGLVIAISRTELEAEAAKAQGS